jgi:hypothetical protein
MVAMASRIRPRKGCIHVGFDLNRPQPVIHVPQWFQGGGRCRRLPPTGRIPCGILSVPPTSPPSPLRFLDGQQNSPTTMYRTFSLYIRRLQDFMVRERPATRMYTESEALDLSVRNLTSERRYEVRRLVEWDKRTGHDGALPFKLYLAQLATTFVEYANEIGRDPHHPRRPTLTVRQLPLSDVLRLRIQDHPR